MLVLLAVILLPLLSAEQSGEIRVLKVTDGKLFQMGGVKAYRVVHPDMGAKKLTLNLGIQSAFWPMSELAGHHILQLDDSPQSRQAEIC